MNIERKNGKIVKDKDQNREYKKAMIAIFSMYVFVFIFSKPNLNILLPNVVRLKTNLYFF